ncbi:uncharacterized protein LOC143853523 isoform X2 [Tasmannia lanceolata]|uniref:uncharacterized protein LOC143853523 isoform X2 n=1 Tax=Tasmannia lanceolata TaxID=3420 RepID=UPI004062EFD4
MVRSKPPSSKKQKRGVDFNKIKRKLGRKLPPPKNATDTNVKSKAIILPEQSVASNRVGLAVSKKGLTLKELLQQTSHHNAKIRKDALLGIKDLTLKYPTELRLHKLAIIEKLRERISDDDKVVRETLYQLLKSVIFSGSKEDIPGPIISLIMAYVFNAMTHFAIDIRLMAFKFFELVVLHYPSTFFLYAEKVLQNYEDILRNNQTYLQDKSKIKIALTGLVRCLSLLACDKRKADPPCEQGALHAFESEVPKDHNGVSFITKKLEGLMPILINCFQDFSPVVRGMPVVETQSFDCILLILECINLAIKYFVHGIDRPQSSFGVFTPSLYKGSNVTTWGESFVPLLLKKLFEAFPLNPVYHSAEKEDHRYFILNVGITEIFLHLSEWIGTPAVLMEKFLEFLENVLSGQICSDKRSNRALREKHLVLLLPFIPKIVSEVSSNWKSRLLEAFTKAFEGCKPESTLNLACLVAAEAMLLPTQREGGLFLNMNTPDMLGYQVTWMRKLPELLLQLGDRHPSASKAVLHLQHRLGQCIPTNPSLSVEYENMQCQLREFYSIYVDEGAIRYGPFIKLPKDCQELAICSLYYFSFMDSLLLESLTCCCLCDDLEPYVTFRIIEVLHSAYKTGHVHIADHSSFLVTLLGRIKVFPEKFCFGPDNENRISNRGTFKAITDAICSCLSQMGDDALVLKLLLKTILNEMSLKPPLDNMRAMLRVVIMLDSRPTVLSEESIGTLSDSLSGYLINAASYIPDNDDDSSHSEYIRICQYYIQPAILLFARSDKLLRLVLDLLGSSIMDFNSTLTQNGTQHTLEASHWVRAVTFIIIFMHKDAKLHQSLSSCKVAIKSILENVLVLQASHGINMALQERYRIQYAFDQVKIKTGTLQSWDTNDFKRISDLK